MSPGVAWAVSPAYRKDVRVIAHRGELVSPAIVFSLQREGFAKTDQNVFSEKSGLGLIFPKLQ